MKGLLRAVSIFVLLNALLTSVFVVQGTMKSVGRGPSTGIAKVPGGFGFYRCNPIPDKEKVERSIGQLFLIWLIAVPLSIGLWKIQKWAIITEIVIWVLALFLYGLVSLIFGLPIIIILSIALTKLAKSRDFSCQNCGASLEIGMAFCPNCGFALVSQIQQDSERKCPNPDCGRVVSEKAKFCKYCGIKLSEA